MASSADEMPPCAADHATGSSRNLRTSASADSARYGRSLQRLQHVPPRAQMVQGDVHPRQGLERAREHAVEEHDERVVHDRARVTQRLREADLRLPVGGEVLDQQRALALRHVALDQRIATEALRLLAHIRHRSAHPIGDPGGERDAGGLAAGDRLDRLVADMTVDLLHPQFADLRSCAREVDDPPAVDIDRRFPARGEGIGLFRPEIDRLDLQQDARGGERRVAVPIGGLSGCGSLGHYRGPCVHIIRSGSWWHRGS